MSVRIPPGFMNVVITGTTSGSERPWAISHGYEIEALGSDAASDFAENIGNSDWVENAAQDLVVSQVDLVVGTSNPSAPIHFTAGIDASGESGAPSGPNVAWLVRKHTLLGGRKGRGRTYFPGVTEASVGDGGQVNEGDGSLRTSLEGFWNGITTGVTGPVDLVLLHEDLTAPTSVSTWVMDNRIATQRRRNRK